LILPHLACAQRGGATTPDGGTFIEIKDGLPRSCINVSKSLVSAYVVAVKATQNTSWLPSWIVSTKNVGVRVNTTFLNATAQTAAFSFPKAKSLRPVGSTDVVTLPLIMELLQRYDLVDQSKSPPTPIGGVTFDVDFINVEQKGTAATVFSQLANFTKNLPIPANPYTTGVQLFGDFANQVLDSAVASDNSANSDDIGSFAYDLAQSDDECATNPRALTEGTTGIIYDYLGSDLAGIIKTGDEPWYCFSIKGSTVSYAAKPSTDFDCLDEAKTKTLTYATLSNPQIIFSFNISGKAGTGNVSRPVASSAPNVPAVSGPAIAQLSQRLAAQLRATTPAETSALQSNIAGWVEGIAKNRPPVQAPTSQAGPSNGTAIELSPTQAREYDAARALLRCARVGIPTQQCN
jgi:hypothetical protein